MQWRRRYRALGPVDSQNGSGGEGGIRTPGPREGSTDFESAPFGRSGTSPWRGIIGGARPARIPRLPALYPAPCSGQFPNGGPVEWYARVRWNGDGRSSMVEFWKYHGLGNDYVVLAGGALGEPPDPAAGPAARPSAPCSEGRCGSSTRTAPKRRRAAMGFASSRATFATGAGRTGSGGSGWRTLDRGPGRLVAPHGGPGGGRRPRRAEPVMPRRAGLSTARDAPFPGEARFVRGPKLGPREMALSAREWRLHRPHRLAIFGGPWSSRKSHGGSEDMLSSVVGRLVPASNATDNHALVALGVLRRPRPLVTLRHRGQMFS